MSETRALYESMSTESLRDLRRAFEMDRAAAQQQETVVFATGRIELIESVLAARGEPRG